VTTRQQRVRPQAASSAIVIHTKSAIGLLTLWNDDHIT